MTIATDRRGLLAAAGTLALGGCAHCTFPAPSAATRVIGDAHAHFFNSADLPVAGFAKFVLIPRHFGGLPEWAEAVVDIIAWTAQVLSLTADAEARQLGAGTLSKGPRAEPEDFGREAARAHRAGLSGRSLANGARSGKLRAGEGAVSADQRAASHRALAALLGSPVGGKGSRDEGLSEAEFTAIASERDRRPPPGPESDLQCPRVQPEDFRAKALPGVRYLLNWAYLLCRPRCVHVEKYLGDIRHDGARIGDVVNLLIDYDKWLDDTPRDGSDTASQVAYWTRYSDISATASGRPLLHTFAGYDPLRDAEERVLESKSDSATSFAALQQWALDGRKPGSTSPRRIVGFKVYPPMGFRPDTNAKIDIPQERGGLRIHEDWGVKFGQIGQEIDNSLNALFKFCCTHDIPIMTHSRESNIALPEHGDDPSPRHWLKRALMVREAGLGPLRLCFGHFDLINCKDSPKGDKQVLFEALKLNAKKESRLYFDVSFDDRILSGQAKALFRELGQICDDAGDDGDFVMFGSDWIMLANQPKVGEYLNLAYAAASEDEYWRDERRLAKLFGGNLKTFLNLPEV